MSFGAWHSVVWCGLMLIAIGVGLLMFHRGHRVLGIIQVGLCTGSLAWHVFILAINASGGCYPWSPKTVVFHQGMTICPGQSAVGAFRIEMPPPPEPAASRKV